MLTTLGHEVITAVDGEEAIEQMHRHNGQIDVVLMDQSMPRKDGATAAREIRAFEADGTLSRHTPIIAVTAVVGPHAQALCRSAGMDDFLTKPLSLVNLERTLSAYLPMK